jgi:hypothetical protein
LYVWPAPTLPEDVDIVRELLGAKILPGRAITLSEKERDRERVGEKWIKMNHFDLK